MQISYDEGNVVLTKVRDFDLAQTLECGQCFHFKKLAEQEYAVCAFHRLLCIRQEEDSVILFDTTMQDYEMIWRDYFDFDRDYGRIKAALLQTDDTLKQAVETMQGVHILQQEFFETLISFIISPAFKPALSNALPSVTSDTSAEAFSLVAYENPKRYVL